MTKALTILFTWTVFFFNPCLGQGGKAKKAKDGEPEVEKLVSNHAFVKIKRKEITYALFAKDEIS
ncbi:MAG: hypothetical protein AAF570_18815, partial [Bacteroidota bacterium]